MTDTALAAIATEDIPELPQTPLLLRKRPTLTHYLMVIPVILLFTLFIVVPAIEGAFYSFTNYAGYGQYHGVGFSNYKALFQDPNTFQPTASPSSSP